MNTHDKMSYEHSLIVLLSSACSENGVLNWSLQATISVKK